MDGCDEKDLIQYLNDFLKFVDDEHGYLLSNCDEADRIGYPTDEELETIITDFVTGP